jgi:hypothetical protein
MGTGFSCVCGSNKDIQGSLLGTSMNLEEKKVTKRQDKLGKKK